jgi:hypothetical protein
MKDSGLYLGGRNFLTEREEDFMSGYAEKIPLVGDLVKASERAYMGYLNRLRADVFDSLYYKGQENGIHWKTEGKKLRGLAEYVNTATGRGSLGQFEQAATAASTIFFSPRLIASRVKILNPMYYAKLHAKDPMLAKEALRDLAGVTMIASSMLGLASAAGYEVETDPRSTDFAKIKNGETRIDITGGFQPYLRLIAQLATGERKNAKGKVEDVAEAKFGQRTRWDLVVDFFKNKLAPLPGYAAGWADQSKALPFDEGKEAFELIMPMYLSSIQEAYNQEGASSLWYGIPSFLGFGVQTYETREKKEEPSKKWLTTKTDEEWLGTKSQRKKSEDEKWLSE